MLQISKSSWHYRYMEWMCLKIDLPGGAYPSNRKSICPYFWSLMALLTIPYISMGILLLELWGLGITIWSHAQATLIIVILIAAIIGIVILAIRRSDRIAAAKMAGTWKPKVKQPNVAWEFVKAKKSNVCPLVEFTE